ncbi:hypothetical protein [Nocardia iowensis]|uniref:Uncharacterized protein n=1 Tax=Nocardia iowensis TaxID=204891 RepID=A0ABX8RRX9_NOCIO|nr:hypothetical protein [Nocardia iowensis]QXN91639.1 hypothetical protein KV110_41255 [Nocardia iowensis]
MVGRSVWSPRRREDALPGRRARTAAGRFPWSATVTGMLALYAELRIPRPFSLIRAGPG